MTPLASVVLAAGKGKRMKSELPKVLHPFAHSTIIDLVLDTVSEVEANPCVLITGHKAEEVEEAVRGRTALFARQTEQLGTGHAVMQARDALAGFRGTVLVLVGDVPLLRSETLNALLDLHSEKKAACTLLTAEFADPKGYGRIVRNAQDGVQAIVEHKDASPEILRIAEINSGIMAFESDALWQHIDGLSRGNAQAEYYLTDLVEIFRQNDLNVEAYCVSDEYEVHGINSSEQLAELERIYRERQSPSGERD
jgi:bifunctional UDP-N-acetylglucosamine pyrophosphorylase/glucosamine-1-phosphate N-acetyltransferase